MSVNDAARNWYSRLLHSLRDKFEGGPEPESIAKPAEPPSEFESFLDDLGAEPPAADSELSLKDTTIAELTARLKDLQDLGDRLAATEQERLRGLERIAELEARLEEAPGPSTDSKLEAQVAKLTRARDRETERLDRMRAKYEERKRVAAERWRELLELKRELKVLRTKGDSKAA